MVQDLNIVFFAGEPEDNNIKPGSGRKDLLFLFTLLHTEYYLLQSMYWIMYVVKKNKNNPDFSQN